MVSHSHSRGSAGRRVASSSPTAHEVSDQVATLLPRKARVNVYRSEAIEAGRASASWTVEIIRGRCRCIADDALPRRAVEQALSNFREAVASSKEPVRPAPPPAMKFNLHPWIYRVRICPGPLAQDGAPVAATAHGREILLCGTLKPHERTEVLIDQLRRLREMHHGAMPAEGIASFVADVMRQLLAQGGEAALMRLESRPPVTGHRRRHRQPTSIRLHVGPSVYTAKVVSGRLTDAAGNKLLGKAMNYGREIHIWSGVPANERLEILLHEVKHAWLFHVPRPATEEDSCKLFAMVAEQFWADLNRAGGRKTLLHLSPVRIKRLRLGKP